ncbi:MAG: VanZ family protein [Sphingobacteriales bacterium]|jgi:VanZ family protein|nr:VanZ family protein [Sphingobacteriales bacterium]
MNKKILYNYLPAVLWSAFIFFLCFIPGSTLPKEDWLDKIHFDKIVHVILYLILFLLIIHAFKQQSVKPSHLVAAAFLCLTQGVIIEYIQGTAFIRDRSFDLWDIAANGLGVLTGILVSQSKHKTN